jgi:aminoglycoside phosphotransferase
MDEFQINLIFEKQNLGNIFTVEKIPIGYVNKVYSINNKFILKICSDSTNEPFFMKEVYFYKKFEGKIKTPKIIHVDTSKSLVKHFFMIYEKLKGDTLYSTWRFLETQERRKIIKELSETLSIIHHTPFNDFIEDFNVETKINWCEKILKNIEFSLSIVEKKKAIPSDFIEEIRNFVKKNEFSLKEQTIGLIHKDVHFDNLLVDNYSLSGIIDLERVELGSIDYELDSIARMVSNPCYSMSLENDRKEVNKKDYVSLMVWVKEFYPDLFQFEHLEIRLSLYSINHDLHSLKYFVEDVSLKESIAKTIGRLKS